MKRLLPLALLAACGDKETKPNPTVLEQIRTEVARITPFVDPGIYQASGDSLIFSGILSSTFPWACENVKASQFPDGSFARSPRHREIGDPDFSRDAAIGILWSVKSGCLNTSQVVKWVEFINEHDCLSVQCDPKAQTPGTFKRLVEKVTGLRVSGAWVIAGSWVPTTQSWFNSGSELFLDHASVYLYGGTMEAKDEGNPFYQFVAGDRQKAADLLLPMLRSVTGPAECYGGECGYLRFGLQFGAPYRPEELVWVANLLGGKQ